MSISFAKTEKGATEKPRCPSRRLRQGKDSGAFLRRLRQGKDSGTFLWRLRQGKDSGAFLWRLRRKRRGRQGRRRETYR